MKRLGASGKGMQFTSAKRGSQRPAPMPGKGDNPPGVPQPIYKAWTSMDNASESLVRDTGKPIRERQRNAGGGATTIHATYGRGANDGSKDSPRKKIW